MLANYFIFPMEARPVCNVWSGELMRWALEWKIMHTFVSPLFSGYPIPVACWSGTIDIFPSASYSKKTIESHLLHSGVFKPFLQICIRLIPSLLPSRSPYYYNKIRNPNNRKNGTFFFHCPTWSVCSMRGGPGGISVNCFRCSAVCNFQKVGGI